LDSALTVPLNAGSFLTCSLEFRDDAGNLLASVEKRSSCSHNLAWVRSKGVGPSTTLAWPQPDIPVEVDTARLETSRFKNGFANCVLLYHPSSELESTFNAY
jgi:hypothetical protein